LTYLAVVFLIFPGIVWTGLGMSFGMTSVFPILATSIGGHQSARTLHFVFVVLLLLFVAVHVTMLVLAGFWRNVRAMITGYLPHGSKNSTTKFLLRRRFITAGLATAAGASGLGTAVYFANRYGLIPPDHSGVIGIGETLTFATQRLLTSEHSLAREFERSEISHVAPVNGPHPTDEKYQALLADGFKDWRLSIEGLVTRPVSLSVDDLKRLPAENHILLHACEEGWSYIAEWTGVRLATVLDLAGLRPEARYIVFEPFANPNQARTVVRVLWETIDMADALHPQTMLAYGMNGEALPPDHGAPVRLRMGRQLGYKNTKYLSRIVVTNDRDFYRKGRGTWYGGI
jgi:DMSO/TMAO reductase YedYZ molybdopterin-dependent catalytic subunit